MIGRRSGPRSPQTEGPRGFDEYDVRLGDIMRGERATMGKSLLDVQRELKIRAAYIAAIENADTSAFETPGFIAGYVRSYARYLSLDPDETFRRFCHEAGFTPSHGMATGASGTAEQRSSIIRAPARAQGAIPGSEGLGRTFVPHAERWISRVEPKALGSVIVLLTLVGAIGYGGWSVLQEVQRVQLAPIDRAPEVVVQIDPLGSSNEGATPAAGPAESATAPGGAAAFAANGSDPAQEAGDGFADRAAQPQALDVPVMVARNGPIGTIDPHASTAASGTAEEDGIEAAIAEALDGDIQVTAEAPPAVEVLAVRPSWVRVSLADGTVVLEKILDAGERYALPALDEPARFRTGNSGAVYFVVAGKTYGPAAPGANVVKGITLSPEALTERYAEADPGNDRDLARILTADASAGQ